MSAKEIMEEALKLSPDEREQIAEELYASLLDPQEPALTELNRRWDELVSGTVTTVSLEESLAQARVAVGRTNGDFHYCGA